MKYSHSSGKIQINITGKRGCLGYSWRKKREILWMNFEPEGQQLKLDI